MMVDLMMKQLALRETAAPFTLAAHTVPGIGRWLTADYDDRAAALRARDNVRADPYFLEAFVRDNRLARIVSTTLETITAELHRQAQAHRGGVTGPKLNFSCYPKESLIEGRVDLVALAAAIDGACLPDPPRYIEACRIIEPPTYRVIGGSADGKTLTVLHGRRVMRRKPSADLPSKALHDEAPPEHARFEYEYYTIRHVAALGCEALVLDGLEDDAIEKLITAEAR